MTFEQRYKKAKKKLLQDPAICEPNRALFAEFLEYQEYKLKRVNGLAQSNSTNPVRWFQLSVPLSIALAPGIRLPLANALHPLPVDLIHEPSRGVQAPSSVAFTLSDF